MLVSGDAECEVTVSSSSELQCVLRSAEKTYIITNQGVDHGTFVHCFVFFSHAKQQYSAISVVNMR